MGCVYSEGTRVSTWLVPEKSGDAAALKSIETAAKEEHDRETAYCNGFDDYDGNYELPTRGSASQKICTLANREWW